jgi:hypothetical protein
MIVLLRLQQKFSRLTLNPRDALELFQKIAFDDPDVRHRISTSIIWNMCTFSGTRLCEVLTIFRERRLLNNLDLRIGSRVLDSILAEPCRIRCLDLETTMYLRDIVLHDDHKEQLSWAVDHFSVVCESVTPAADVTSTTFSIAARMLQTYPLALKWCNAASKQLDHLYQSASPPSLEQTLDLLQVLSRLGHDACPAELRARVIKCALTSNALPTAGALAAIDSFTIMGCWNAVGAMLLKYHGTLAKLSHGAWSSCCRAALKASVQNPSTRRALLQRGGELRSGMNIVELELQCKCEQSWSDVCSPAWISTAEVVERIRLTQSECTNEQLLAFAMTSIHSREHHHVAWALISALVHRVASLAPDEVLSIMRTLRAHRFRHEGMIHRLGLFHFHLLNFELALEYFFFCEAFRISCAHPGNSLIAPAEFVLSNVVLVSYLEALAIMRAMLVCSFQQLSLMHGMLSIVSLAIDMLSSQQLYVLAACHRLCENDDKRLTAAIEGRAYVLLEALDA